MKRAKEACARKPGHRGDCRTAKGLADSRQRLTERRRGRRLSVDPAARARWRRTHKLLGYGLTQEVFARFLAVQGSACGMCHKKFEEGQYICIDHDHSCCPGEKQSCGMCVRGLLCMGCNRSLGHIERRYADARAYLDAPPAATVLSG
jgi:hypothetical protein